MNYSFLDYSLTIMFMFITRLRSVLTEIFLATTMIKQKTNLLWIIKINFITESKQSNVFITLSLFTFAGEHCPVS